MDDNTGEGRVEDRSVSLILHLSNSGIFAHRSISECRCETNTGRITMRDEEGGDT